METKNDRMKSKKSLGKRKQFVVKEAIAFYLFVLPIFSIFAVFKLAPLFINVFTSFFTWDLATFRFSGLKNYREFLLDPYFYQAFKNTILIVLSVPIGIILALALALMVNTEIRFRSFFRVVYFIPAVMSMIICAMIWKWIYAIDGLLNQLLNVAGLPSIRWLTSTTWALPSVIALGVWKGLGYNMVIFLAGLQVIPKQLYDAGKMDGTSTWQKFRFITLPLLQHTTLFVFVVSAIGSIQVFDQVYIMTEGEPRGSTTVLMYYLYRQGFEFFRFGYASAIAFLLFVIILVLSLVQIKYLSPKFEF